MCTVLAACVRAHVCVRACVCVCVRACVSACVRACVCVCAFAQIRDPTSDYPACMRAHATKKCIMQRFS